MERLEVQEKNSGGKGSFQRSYSNSDLPAIFLETALPMEKVLLAGPRLSGPGFRRGKKAKGKSH